MPRSRWKYPLALVREASSPSAELHIRAVSAGKKESVEVLLEKGVDVEAKDSGGVTPLMLAAHYGRGQLASLLIQKGAHVDPKEEYANTPLHSAAESGHLNLVELLIAKGADVNRQDERYGTAVSRQLRLTCAQWLHCTSPCIKARSSRHRQEAPPTRLR